MPPIFFEKLLTLSFLLGTSWLSATELTIGDLAMNTAENLPPYTSMITGFAYIMGIAFLVSAMFKLKRHSEQPQQVPLLAPVIFTAMGVLLIYFPTTITTLRDTFFGSNNTATGMDIYQSGETMDGTKAQSGSST